MATSTTTTSFTNSTVSSVIPSCTTAVPGKYGHVPADACNAEWNFSPNFAAAVAFAVLFGMSAVAHAVQGVLFKKVHFQFAMPDFGTKSRLMVQLPEILLGHRCCLSLGNSVFRFEGFRST
jgi:hypothetical protein